jgi:glycosyltransferase involved in cell wall biosynthesis
MIAYNHEACIAEAIESVMAQKTDFSFDLVIGDDNSSDATQNICESYAAKHPGRIKYCRREKNMGMMPNFIATLQSCTGQYIAICEGDDYWTDISKLQLQAEFLDKNPDFTLCCHNHSVLAKGKMVSAGRDFSEEYRTVKTEEYLLHPFFHTTSYFFRKSAMPYPFPDWYTHVLAGDHFLVLFLAMKGKIGCLNKRMSVFRNHGSSVSFTRSALDIKQNFVKHLQLFNDYSDRQYQPVINTVIRKWDLLYKVYEPVGYFKKLAFFFSNTGFYLRHFSYLGGPKLFIKYLLPASVLRSIKG